MVIDMHSFSPVKELDQIVFTETSVHLELLQITHVRLFVFPERDRSQYGRLLQLQSDVL